MRKTHRSNKGPKLYPLGSVKSRLRDIETYQRSDRRRRMKKASDKT